jgi:hypothetical protein
LNARANPNDRSERPAVQRLDPAAGRSAGRAGIATIDGLMPSLMEIFCGRQAHCAASGGLLKKNVECEQFFGTAQQDAAGANKIGRSEMQVSQRGAWLQNSSHGGWFLKGTSPVPINLPERPPKGQQDVLRIVIGCGVWVLSATLVVSGIIAISVLIRWMLN